MTGFHFSHSAGLACLLRSRLGGGRDAASGASKFIVRGRVHVDAFSKLYTEPRDMLEVLYRIAVEKLALL